MTRRDDREIVIPYDLGEQLRTIASGPDDVGSLARRMRIRPEEFAAFMRDAGLVDDPDARSIYWAALVELSDRECAHAQVADRTADYVERRSRRHSEEEREREAFIRARYEESLLAELDRASGRYPGEKAVRRVEREADRSRTRTAREAEDGHST